MKIYLKIIIVIATLFSGAGIVIASDLRDCPEYRDPTLSIWHNCFGTFTYASGDKYVGEFKDDKRHGQGTYTYGPNSEWAGDKYVGMFKDGKRNGHGTLTWKDGTVQEGIWKDGEFQYAQKLPANSSSSGNSKLDTHKEFCEEIGFVPGTEKFGDCVMKMMDKD